MNENYAVEAIKRNGTVIYYKSSRPVDGFLVENLAETEEVISDVTDQNLTDVVNDKMDSGSEYIGATWIDRFQSVVVTPMLYTKHRHVADSLSSMFWDIRGGHWSWGA